MACDTNVVLINLLETHNIFHHCHHALASAGIRICGNVSAAVACPVEGDNNEAASCKLNIEWHLHFFLVIAAVSADNAGDHFAVCGFGLINGKADYGSAAVERCLDVLPVRRVVRIDHAAQLAERDGILRHLGLAPVVLHAERAQHAHEAADERYDQNELQCFREFHFSFLSLYYSVAPDRS